jgi:hypothetical protein
VSIRPRFDVNTVVAAATIAIACAAILFAGLTILARPRAYSARLAAAEHTTGSAETLLQKAGDPGAYPPGALCRGSPVAAADAFRAKLRAVVAGAGGTVALANADPEASVDPVGNLTPVSIELDANGPYEGMVNALSQLARAQPELFIDSVDLKSQISTVNLKIAGRFYCSISARL